jgi:HAD superfamily hydrolase (TIGR01509 family)
MRIKRDKQIKAFIFDNDGVVINSEPLIFEATARVFSAYGINLKKEDVQKGIGAGSKYVEYPRDKYGLVYVSIEELMKARENEFRILAADRLQPFPGFFTLMKLLRQRGIRTALASSAATEVVYYNLSLAGIEPNLFDHIVDSTRIKNKKPAPDIFLAASEHLGIPPRNCLVIEDAPPGIEAARKAEMKVVALATTLPKSFLSNSDYVVDSFEDLIAMVDEFIEGSSNENK